MGAEAHQPGTGASHGRSLPGTPQAWSKPCRSPAGQSGWREGEGKGLLAREGGGAGESQKGGARDRSLSQLLGLALEGVGC